MTMSNTFETELLTNIFNNTPIANIGDATGLRGSSAAGSLYVSLHTADPGEAGTAATSEATYTSYARTAVARTSGGWTISGNTVSNAAAVAFPACTGGSNTITHFAVVKEVSGTSVIIVSGALTASLAISSGITPQFAIGALTATAD